MPLKQKAPAILFSLFILTIGAGLGRAGEEEPGPNKEKRGRWLVLPIFYYSPETRIAAGLGGVYYFRPGGEAATVRPSQIWLAVIGTQNKQFMISATPELYLRGETFIVRSNVGIERYPQKFFGVGNDTPDSAEEDFTRRRGYLELTALKKIRPRLYAGLYYDFESYKVTNTVTGGALAFEGIPGSRTSTVSGAGLAMAWDSRDNIFSPRRGSFSQVWLAGYHKALGSSHGFLRLKLDMRRYLPVFATHVLALQAQARVLSGTPPFSSLSMLGGDMIMRGYYQGRYRDKNLIAFQTEYRAPVWGRLGLVAFAGLGDVADRLDRFRLGSFKPSFGWGLRFMFDTKEKANLRLDFGYGKGSSGMYITANEAF